MPRSPKQPTRRESATPPADSTSGEVADFLARVAGAPKPGTSPGSGRLIVALDATASREPAWDRAAEIQARMFEEAGKLGGLEVQLAYYRGVGEFRASPWCRDTGALAREMTGVMCRAGRTQIARVLRHARDEARRGRVGALVFVGDCLEENVDRLCALAGELGLLGVPAFLFHEGGDTLARQGFERIAALSGGACCRFDAASPDQLRDLLAAVAVYAAGGRPALEHHARSRGGAADALIRQLPAPPGKGR